MDEWSEDWEGGGWERMCLWAARSSRGAGDERRMAGGGGGRMVLLGILGGEEI